MPVTLSRYWPVTLPRSNGEYGLLINVRLPSLFCAKSCAAQAVTAVGAETNLERCTPMIISGQKMHHLAVGIFFQSDTERLDRGNVVDGGEVQSNHDRVADNSWVLVEPEGEIHRVERCAKLVRPRLVEQVVARLRIIHHISSSSDLKGRRQLALGLVTILYCEELALAGKFCDDSVHAQSHFADRPGLHDRIFILEPAHFLDVHGSSVDRCAFWQDVDDPPIGSGAHGVVSPWRLWCREQCW
eukprot:7381201-Prymnesium_polylepis.2